MTAEAPEFSTQGYLIERNLGIRVAYLKFEGLGWWSLIGLPWVNFPSTLITITV